MQISNLFSILGWKLSDDRKTVTFSYSHDIEDGSKESFTESFIYPVELDSFDTSIKNALDSLAIVVGTSYYKMYCPKEISVNHMKLGDDQISYWETMYTKGLGEFYYQNTIDFRGLVKIIDNGKLTNESNKKPWILNRVEDDVKNKKTALVAWGGGKDSIVAFEMLKQKGYDCTLFSVRTSPIQQQTAQVTGRSYVVIQRVLDPLMIEKSKNGSAYPGHVPITMINTWASLPLGLALGRHEIVFAAEKSSDYGNVQYLGMEINHQWSKTAEAEKLTSIYIKDYIDNDLHWYSIIADMWEIDVVKEFVNYPQYFSTFSSCNRNFTLVKSTLDKRWCGQCSKCAFVFLLLAAYVDKQTLIPIFDKDVLDDENLIPIYRELLGYDIKPFECVGTPEEVTKAFEMIVEKGDFDESRILRKYKNTKLK